MAKLGLDPKSSPIAWGRKRKVRVINSGITGKPLTKKKKARENVMQTGAIS